MEHYIEVALSALRDARDRLSGFRGAGFSTPEALPSEQAINDLLRSNLKSVGFDLDKFDTLTRQNIAEARRQTANRKAQDDKQALAMLPTLLHGVEICNSRISNLRALLPPDNYVVLNTADQISSSENISIVSTHIGPSSGPNSAQFSYGGGNHSGFAVEPANLSFFFSWQNPSESLTFVNIAGFIALMGFCTVSTDGGLIVPGYNSDMRVDANLHIHELWNDPPTSPMSQPAQSQNALHIHCNTFGIFQQVHTSSQSIVKGFELQYNQFVMPPKGTAIFEVACELHSVYVGGGDGTAWFRGEGRQLLCPAVAITILS
jgi:hypothetical protein